MKQSRVGTTRRLGVQGAFLGASIFAACSLLSLGAWAEDDAAEAETAESGSSEDLDTARVYFKNGVELLQGSAPNYQDAYRQFELARQLSGSWKVLGNLGLCALKLERDGEALQFYSEYLKEGGDEIDPGEREHIERELLLIQGNMAKVQIKSSEPDAKVSVTRKGSTVPTQLYELEGQETELGLRSGSLVITAQNSEKTLTWEVVLSAGESASHVFDFSAEPEATPTAASTAAPRAEESAGPSGMRIAGYVTAGVGVLALGGGVVTGVLSSSKEKSAQKECIGNVCPASAEKDFNNAKSMATVANVLFISGGVLAATGVTLIIVGGNKSDPGPQDTARLQINPLVTLGGGGLAAAGHF